MTLEMLLRKSQSLKDKAIMLDVKEYVWCQRGSANEKIELISVIPTKHNDQALCVFHTKHGDQSGWFAASFYLTKKSTDAALLTGWHHKIYGDNSRTYGIRAELITYPFEVLQSNLVRMGLQHDLISKFGIVKAPIASCTSSHDSDNITQKASVKIIS